MSSLANVNAGAAGLAPPGPEEELYTVQAHLRPALVIRSGAPTDPRAVLSRPVGVPDRPQYMDVGFWTRPWKWWANFTGAHGVIGEAPELAGMSGGQHAWPNYNRRTFRQSPEVPWDEGTAGHA